MDKLSPPAPYSQKIFTCIVYLFSFNSMKLWMNTFFTCNIHTNSFITCAVFVFSLGNVYKPAAVNRWASSETVNIQVFHKFFISSRGRIWINNFSPAVSIHYLLHLLKIYIIFSLSIHSNENLKIQLFFKFFFIYLPAGVYG